MIVRRPERFLEQTRSAGRDTCARAVAMIARDASAVSGGESRFVAHVRLAGTAAYRADCHCVRKRSDLIFFWPCGCVPISARQLNWRVVRVRNELEYRAMHRWLPTLYLYYRPHRNHPPPLLFPTPADDNEGLHPSGRSSEAVHLSSPPHQFPKRPFPSFFFSPGSFFPFLQNGRHEHPHNVRSSLHRHHRFFIVRVKLPLCH